VWLTFDDAHRKLYVCIVNSDPAKDGIFVLDLTSNVWSKLNAPTRSGNVVQHPFNVRVFANGDLLASYCAHQVGDASISPPTITDGAYKPTSGVFFLSNGSSTWQDRTNTKVEMRYFTRDVIIDPSDASGLTWFATVWNTDSNLVTPADATATPQSWGGLYRTTDGGVNWTRIWSGDATFSGSATSCTLHPEAALKDELLLTTRFSGLWITQNIHAATPVFSRVNSYAFRAPERAYYDPYDHDKIWITSYGNGIVSGTRSTSFGEYQMRVFGSQTGIAVANADADGDGASNLLEYALRGNPLVPSSNLFSGGQSNSSSPLRLNFNRYLAASDTTWIIEGSADLINWQPLAKAIGTGAWTVLAGGTLSEDANGSVIFTDTILPGTNPRRFLRLNVSGS